MPARRKIAAFLALSALAAGALCGVSIEAVSTRTFSVEELTTLGEYLGGHEHYGRRTYLRSDPDRKAGMYFIVDFDENISKLPANATLVLDVVRADDGQYATINLSMADAKGSMGRALYVGLTDLENRGRKLLAWRVSVVDSSGVVLAQKHSFLWTMPRQ